VDNLCVTEYFRIRASKALLQKCDPLSLIIAQEAPKREMTFSLRNLIIILLSFVLVGIASTHFDTKSTATYMYWLPKKMRNGTMKSIQTSKSST